MTVLTFQLKNHGMNTQGRGPCYAMYGPDEPDPAEKFIYKCSGPKFPAEIAPGMHMNRIPGNPFDPDMDDADQVNPYTV